MLVAMMVPSLLGVAALAVDGGSWGYSHMNLQGAADLAAYSAAKAYTTNNGANITTEAEAIVAKYGIIGATVNAYNPPVSDGGTCSLAAGDAYFGNTNAFEVIVSKSYAPILSKIVGVSNSVTVCSRAIAGLVGNGDCALSLGTTGTTISVTGNNADVQTTGCGLFSNSSDPHSISVGGQNDAINLLGGGVVGSVGGVSDTGGGGRGGTGISPAPETGLTPVPDPYASEASSWSACPTGITCSPSSPLTCGGIGNPPCTATTPPTTTTCSPSVTTGHGHNAVTTTYPCNAATSLSPGVYPNGITLSANNTTYTMSAGVYYVGNAADGIGLELTGQSVTLNATGGVTIVLTGNSIVNMTGNSAALNLTAPTTGWSEGIAIWEPTSTGSNQFAGGNTNVDNITGVIYTPNANVTYTGNSTGTPTCTQIISKTLTLQGNNISFKGNCGLAGVKNINQIVQMLE